MSAGLLSLWLLSHITRTYALERETHSSPKPPLPVDEAVNNGTYGYYPTYTFFTEEELNAPITNFMQWDERCNDGLMYFLTPRGWGIQNPGPMILDERGDLIWAKHFANQFGGQAYDFMVQQYQGQDYLTFWLGDDRVRGHGSGFYYMLNSSYDVVHRVGAAGGLNADLHEFLITEQGTALIQMYEVAQFDITYLEDYPHDRSQLGPSYIWDCIFQEIDIESGDLLFAWRASEHIDVRSTYRAVGVTGLRNDPFDWLHINSIDKDESGNYLISSRYTHSITYINGQTGEIIWTLGGKANNFMDLGEGDALNFAWQHDARFVSVDTFPSLYRPPEEQEGFVTKLLTLFDNAAEDRHYEYGLEYSRGLLLEITYPTTRSKMDLTRSSAPLDRRDMDLNQAKVLDINGTSPDYTVRVVQTWVNPDGIRSSSQGSLQLLPEAYGQDPKIFIGYGLNPVWTEFAADGTVLCDVHYGAVTSYERGDIQSYRTYKFPWVGRPERPPVIDISDDDAEIYVSWNGATEVTDWIVQCAERITNDDAAWEDLVQTEKGGFETAIALPQDEVLPRYLRVIALDGNGHRMEWGATAALDRGIIATYLPILNGKASPMMTRMTGANLLLVLVFALGTIFVLLHAYRRLLSWRTGRQSAGPFRFRNAALYRLIGEA